MSGVYTDRTETVQEERRRIRITCGSAIIHSFPIPLGTEIGHLDRTVTTNVTFSGSFAIDFVIAFESTCTYLASEIQDERHHTRITCGPVLIYSFPVPLGAEIGHLDRTVTTNVTSLAHMLLILLLLSAAVARI